MNRRWIFVSLLVVAFLLGGLLGASGHLGSDRFTDVPKGHWADEAIGWAVRNEITAGVSETLFDPDGTVTRAQIVTFLKRLNDHWWDLQAQEIFEYGVHDFEPANTWEKTEWTNPIDDKVFVAWHLTGKLEYELGGGYPAWLTIGCYQGLQSLFVSTGLYDLPYSPTVTWRFGDGPMVWGYWRFDDDQGYLKPNTHQAEVLEGLLDLDGGSFAISWLQGIDDVFVRWNSTKGLKDAISDLPCY